MAKEDKKTQSNKNKKKEDKKVVKQSEEVKVVKEEVKVTEEKAKPVKKEKFNADKFNDAFNKIDEHRLSIILFIVGFLIATLLFRCILWPDRIATLEDGTQPVVKLDNEVITADDLYASMKKYYSVNVLLNNVDDKILTKLYPADDEMENSIKQQAEYYYSAYEKNYNISKSEFLSQYGFSSESDFLDSLRLDYRKNKYYDDYALDLVTDKEIEKYYANEVFGDVDSKHILVSIDSENGLSDEEAKKLAQEIIGKLNKGTSWDDVVKEYKDKIVVEELGYKPFNASLESAYLKELKDLAVGSYSKTPVLTSYGYHIVYKIDQKDKPELKDVRDDIKEILANEKKDNDSNLLYKALIHMREDAGLEFVDTKFADEYKKYCSQYK